MIKNRKLVQWDRTETRVRDATKLNQITDQVERAKVVQ